MSFRVGNRRQTASSTAERFVPHDDLIGHGLGIVARRSIERVSRYPDRIFRRSAQVEIPIDLQHAWPTRDAVGGA